MPRRTVPRTAIRDFGRISASTARPTAPWAHTTSATRPSPMRRDRTPVAVAAPRTTASARFVRLVMSRRGSRARWRGCRPRRRACRAGAEGRARTAAPRRPGSAGCVCTPSKAISTTSSGPDVDAVRRAARLQLQQALGLPREHRVGQPLEGLAEHAEAAVGLARAEVQVRQPATAAAVAPLGSQDDQIQRVPRLHLEPGAAPAARRVRRGQRLHHHTLVPAASASSRKARRRRRCRRPRAARASARGRAARARRSARRPGGRGDRRRRRATRRRRRRQRHRRAARRRRAGSRTGSRDLERVRPAVLAKRDGLAVEDGRARRGGRAPPRPPRARRSVTSSRLRVKTRDLAVAPVHLDPRAVELPLDRRRRDALERRLDVGAPSPPASVRPGRPTSSPIRRRPSAPSPSAVPAAAARSPPSIAARRTSAIGTAAAWATASAMTPASAPWRRSPRISATRNSCSAAVARPKSRSTSSGAPSAIPGPASVASSLERGVDLADRERPARRPGPGARGALPSPRRSDAGAVRPRGTRRRRRPRRARARAGTPPGGRSWPCATRFRARTARRRRAGERHAGAGWHPRAGYRRRDRSRCAGPGSVVDSGHVGSGACSGPAA